MVHANRLFTSHGPMHICVLTLSIPQMEFFHAAQYDGIILGGMMTVFDFF